MNSLAFRTGIFNPNMDVTYETVEASCSDMDPFYGTSHLSLTRYCTPYQDHCYAADLPVMQFDGPDSPPLAIAEPLAAFVDIEDVTTTVVTGGANSMSYGKSDMGGGGGNTSNDPYADSVTRCICDFQHDDGYMICCDRCGVWQHVDCMGVDRKHIPDSYLCELCYPRIVDKRRAIRLQTKKKEELEMESSASATDSGSEERRPKKSGRKRKRVDGSGQPSTVPQMKRARKRTMSELTDDKKIDLHNHKTHPDLKSGSPKRARSQSTGEGSFHRQRRGLANNIQLGLSLEDGGVEDGYRNTYTEEVKSSLMAKAKSMVMNNTSMLKEQLESKRYQVASYGDDAKGLEALEMIKPNQAVAEYTGNVLMRMEYERDAQCDLSYPFTVCYMGIGGMELCVDSSTSENDAKYVRRSCTPNAKVVHVLEKSGLRFYICATKSIPAGREITIPFYFNYQRSRVEVKCPCEKVNCMIAKHFQSQAFSRPSRHARRKFPTSSDAEQEVEKPEKKKAEKSETVVEKKKSDTEAEKKKVESTPVSTDGDKTAAPTTAIRSRRRALAACVEMAKNPVTVSSDVGDDIALMHQLTGGEVNIAPPPQPQPSSPVSAAPAHAVSAHAAPIVEPAPVAAETDAETTHNNDAATATSSEPPPAKQSRAAEKRQSKLSAEQQQADEAATSSEPPPPAKQSRANDKKQSKLLAEIQTSSLVMVDNKDSSKKTREQRKIEAAEKHFEKIEQQLSTRGKSMKTRSQLDKNEKPKEEVKPENNKRSARGKAPIVEAKNTKNSKNSMATTAAKKETGKGKAPAAAASTTNGTRSSTRSRRLQEKR